LFFQVAQYVKQILRFSAKKTLRKPRGAVIVLDYLEGRLYPVSKSLNKRKFFAFQLKQPHANRAGL